MSLFDELTNALLNPSPGERLALLLLGSIGGEESPGGPDDARDEPVAERESTSATAQAASGPSVWSGTWDPPGTQNPGWRYGPLWGLDSFTNAAFTGEPGYVVGLDPDLYADQAQASGNLAAYTGTSDVDYPDAPRKSTPEIDEFRRRFFGDRPLPGPINLDAPPDQVPPPSGHPPPPVTEQDYSSWGSSGSLPRTSPPPAPPGAAPSTPAQPPPTRSLPPLPAPAAPQTTVAPSAGPGTSALPQAPPAAPPTRPAAPLSWGAPLVHIEGVGEVSLLRFAWNRPGISPAPTTPRPAARAPTIQQLPPAPAPPAPEPSSAPQSLWWLVTEKSTFAEQWQRSKLRSNLQDVWQRLQRSGAFDFSRFGEFGSARKGFIANISPVPLPGLEPPRPDDPEAAEWERGEHVANAIQLADALTGFLGPGPGTGAGPLPELVPAPGGTRTIPLPYAPLAPPVLLSTPPSTPPAPPRRPGWSGPVYNHSNTPPVRPPRDVVTPSGGRIRDRGLEGRRPTTDPMRGMQRPHLFEPTDANLKRMLEGRAPVGKDGQKVQLHHRGQYANNRLDEYSPSEHLRELPLHELGRDSEIDHDVWPEQRSRYWVTRARQILRIDESAGTGRTHVGLRPE